MNWLLLRLCRRSALRPMLLRARRNCSSVIDPLRSWSKSWKYSITCEIQNNCDVKLTLFFFENWKWCYLKEFVISYIVYLCNCVKCFFNPHPTSAYNIWVWVGVGVWARTLSRSVSTMCLILAIRSSKLTGAGSTQVVSCCSWLWGRDSLLSWVKFTNSTIKWNAIQVHAVVTKSEGLNA